MALYPDISHWHPITDWAKAKANCPFLISKATQGTSSNDSTLDAFIKGCEENAIPYWLYTYLNKGNEKAQAEYLVSTCSAKVGSHFVGYILDIEAENTAANVQAALDYLSAAGTKIMLYTMYAQYSTYKSVIEGRPSACAWWEARYGQNTGAYNSAYPCHSGADLHQYTSKGTCGGVSGNCDLNRITGAADKDEAWFKTPLSGTSTTTSTATADTAASSAASSSSTKTATDKAAKYDKTLAGTYKVTGCTTLNVRNGAGTGKSVMAAIPTGTEVTNYGYYSLNGSTEWLYVKFTYKSVTYTGFASKKYLTKQ